MERDSPPTCLATSFGLRPDGRRPTIHRIPPGTSRVRVASVPSAHPYVAAIVDPVAVELLADPPVPGAPVGQWWPPRLLDPEWIATRTDAFDVLHLHFGLESHPVDGVARALDLVQRAGRPVVYTVHDLENPQLADQSAHRAMLDEVVPRADALVTLTDAAAAVIAERWGRRARVIPHPRLVRVPAAPASTSAAPSTRRVGLFLRDLRPNVDGVGAVATLVRAIAELRATGLPMVAEVHLDERVRDAAAAERIAALVKGRGDVELHRHPRLDDDALLAVVARLGVLVLPHAWGTHSGWVELAWDAAVPVAGPAAGAIGAQHPSDFEVYALGDPASLARALAAAASRGWGSPGPARAAEQAERAVARGAEQRAVRAAHRTLYRGLTAARVAA